MADPSRIVDHRVYAWELQPSVDFAQLIQEARTRWLRPAEICEILRNYRLFRLTPDPPFKPIGGSMFLYDRTILRYFRRDGHQWRKKRDGKTVREAHEKLKVGSIDVLHCYYAHGENNEFFQRRSYWMLHENTKIVLVHYRDVPPNNKSSTQVSPTEEKRHDLNVQTGPSLQYRHSFASQYSSSGSSQGVPSGNSGFCCTSLSYENSFMIPRSNESSIARQNFYSGSLSPNYSPLQELNWDFGPQNAANIIPQPLTMENEAALLDIEAFLELSSSEFEMSQPIQGQNSHDEIEAFLETLSSELNLETSHPIQWQNSHDENEAFLETLSSELNLETSHPIQGQNSHDEIEAFLETLSSELNLETSHPIQGQNSHDEIEAFLETLSSELNLETSHPIQGQNSHDEIEAFLETLSSELNLETSHPIQGQNSHDLKDLGSIEPWTYTEGSEDSHMEAVSPWGDYWNAPLEVTNHQEETMEEMTSPRSQPPKPDSHEEYLLQVEGLRNSSLAAARIQAALRVFSFRQRQNKERGMREKEDGGNKVIDDVALVCSSSSSSSIHRPKVNTPYYGGKPFIAALKIRQKYKHGSRNRRFQPGIGDLDSESAGTDTILPIFKRNRPIWSEKREKSTKIREKRQKSSLPVTKKNRHGSRDEEESWSGGLQPLCRGGLP